MLNAQGGGTYYLSEGATGSFFDLDILIANPNAADAPVTLTFLREDGGVVDQQRTVPAMQRITVRVDDIAGVEDTPVSTVVKSDDGSPLIVERTMRWDQIGIRRAYGESGGRHGADVVFRGRLARLLLDLSAARESGHDAEHRDGAVPARRLAGADACVSDRRRSRASR